QVFELLKSADFLGISSTYLEKIIRAEHQRESRARVSHIKRERKLLEAQRADLVEPLSRRELEVLRLLTTSLTSTEIAAELYISVSTVRTQIKNIYSKLGVHKRLEAVQVGREIGLL
ncbi:MAG: response regulator transcription factor, partial [Anaerolineales bacterium]|nr:response regulator transcription factor [Anaerolineales bacterium]